MSCATFFSTIYFSSVFVHFFFVIQHEKKKCRNYNMTVNKKQEKVRDIKNTDFAQSAEYLNHNIFQKSTANSNNQFSKKKAGFFFPDFFF